MNKKENNITILQKYRNNLDKTRINICFSFDKYLLTFATGSLYLSILFTSSLSSKNEITYLAIGWSLLIISIISTLLSIFFSIKAHENQIDNTDLMIVAELENKEIIKTNDCCWTTVINMLEIIGIASFIFGIILLSIFYFINFK